MLNLRFYFLLFLFPFKLCAQQQNYIFQHLTTKDGLASNYIQSIFQDSKGFYWIGTTSGLQKFDGYTFSKPLIAGQDLIPSPNVTETKDGTLWISNGTSLFNYNPITKHFKHIEPEGNNPETYFKVIEDSSGNVWLLNNKILYKYDARNGKLVTWMKLPSFDPKIPSGLGSIAFDKKAGIIWLQNSRTLYEISPDRQKIISKEALPNSAAAIWMDDTYLWISLWTAYLCRYNTRTGQKDWFTMPFKNKGSQTINYAVASCFAKDKTGKLWIGSIDGGGLWYFDESINKVLQLKTDNSKPESFHYNELVYTMQPDREGNIWIGSDKGINIFNPTYQSFYTFNNEGLPTKGIASFITKKPLETSTGDILISTNNGGWLHFDNRFKLKRGFTIILNSHSSEIDKNKTSVSCFAEDKRGRIWVGHRGGLLGMYEPQTGAIKYKEIPEFQKLKISSMQCDTAGNMWFAFRSFSNNIAKWDEHLKKFKLYNDSLLINKLDQESAVMITKQGDIWVQTFITGIYRFDPVKEKIAEIYRNEQPPCYIPDAVQEISALNDSVIAVASFGKGFFLFNMHQKTAAPLTTDQGLPSNIAKGIATDRQGNLWIAMLSDLVRMNPITKKITSFDEEEGLINKSFTYGFTKLRDGRLTITTNTGLVYFHPDSVKTQPPPLNVLLTGLKIAGKSILLDSVLAAGNNKLSLTSDQNFLAIDYVSVSFLNRKTTQYFYKLEGLDKNWVKAGTQRVATYTNLSPGNYIFMVKCENRDGISSKNITYLDIIISPPLWRTWWAYTLYVLAAGTLIYALYRNRIRALKNKQADQIKVIVATQEQERKRISRDLHDDVGTKLSALKLFLSSLQEKASRTENEEITSLAKKSEQFIKETIQDIRQLLLNLSPTVLEEFGYTTAVEGLVNKINETKQIYFDLVVFGINHRLQGDYELALYRITQELINNVLKHAEAKYVSLQIGQRNEKIILMIEDDGNGFDVDAHKDGYGLNNLDARTKLMQGTMIIDSQPGKGTSVLIEIPYKLNGV